MYLPDRGLIVTEVAKAGTHSLRQAAKDILGIDQPIAPGHRRVSEIIAHAARFGIAAQRDAQEIVCIVREPFDRLASVANHLNMRGYAYDVRGVVSEMNGTKDIFRPTADYLDVKGIAVKLFPFDRMADAYRYIFGVCEVTLPHENQSEKRFVASDFDLPQVRDFYAKDFDLYERATNG